MRDGTGIYTYPPGTPGVAGQTIFSARYNTFLDDLATTLNTVLPINMGGTGSATGPGAADAIGAVKKSGDTMSGQLTLSYHQPAIQLISTDLGAADLYGGANGKVRWLLRLGDGGMESGGNSGSNFGIYRGDDAGTLIDVPFSITRNTGVVSVGPGGLSLIGPLISAPSITTNYLSLGAATAASPTDLTRHISLFGGSYGFNVTPSTINIVANGIRAAWFDSSNWSFQGNIYTTANGRLWGGADGTPLWLSGGTMSGQIVTVPSVGWIQDTTGGQGAILVNGANGHGAKIAFNHMGVFAGYFGLDYDNQWKVGGWSYGGVSYRIWHEGNINPMPVSGGSFTGTIYAPSIISTGNMNAYGGVYYMSSAGHYFQWDGSNYQMPHGNLYIMGTLAVRTGTDASLNSVVTNSSVDSGGGVYYFSHDPSIYFQWNTFGRNCIYSSQVFLAPNYGSKSAPNVWHFNWEGGLMAYIDNNNWGNVLNNMSDHRLKKDVKPLASMWNVVKRLNPIKYTPADWKPYSESSDEERWGFLAHELQETMIPSVSTGSKDYDGPPQQPNLMALVASLTKALQEAMTRIEALEAAHG